MPLEYRKLFRVPNPNFLYGNSIRLTVLQQTQLGSFYMYTAQDVAYIHAKKRIFLYTYCQRGVSFSLWLWQGYCKTLLIKNNICFYQQTSEQTPNGKAKHAVIEAMFAMKYSGDNSRMNTVPNTRKNLSHRRYRRSFFYPPHEATTIDNFQLKLYLSFSAPNSTNFQFFG